MLLELQVRNVVIIEQATIRPEAGLCVISGETGAGKSLLMDALALVRGERADSRLIGPFGDRAQVVAVIQVAPEVARALAEDLGLEDEAEGQFVLRRRITRSGRSQAWINDVPVAVGALRSLGERLIDIRAQHQHLHLAEASWQRRVLDVHAGLSEQAALYRSQGQTRRRLAEALQAIASGAADSLRERDFLRFQLDEIVAFDPQSGERQELERRQRLLAGAEEWCALAGAAGQALSEADGSVLEIVGGLARRLEEAPEPRLAEAHDLLVQAQTLVDEAARQCLAAEIVVDEAERQAVEERLDGLLDLIRKHGGSEESLLESWARLAARLQELEGLDQRRGELEQAQAEAEDAWRQQGTALRAARRTAFAHFAEQVHGELAALGMPRARLSMIEHPGEGADVQEWMLQANPGMDAGPVAAVASGGEVARLALAVATVTIEQDTVPVVVFDEVDSGVGGRLGLAIAGRLRDLAQGRSVLAITHTPQIAAQAHRQYRVSKEHGADSTAIRVDEVVGDERVGELADMLGGGAAARDQARALLGVESV